MRVQIKNTNEIKDKTKWYAEHKYSGAIFEVQSNGSNFVLAYTVPLWPNIITIDREDCRICP